MQSIAERHEEPTAIRTNLGAIFVSLELSRSIWLITSVSPGGGEKMSKHSVSGGDIRCAADALFGACREGVRADGEILPDHRHSGGWIGRLLDSSRAAEGGN